MPFQSTAPQYTKYWSNEGSRDTMNLYQSSGGFKDFMNSQAYNDFIRSTGHEPGTAFTNFTGTDAFRQQQELQNLREQHFRNWMGQMYKGVGGEREQEYNIWNNTGVPAPTAAGPASMPATGGLENLTPGGGGVTATPGITANAAAAPMGGGGGFNAGGGLGLPGLGGAFARPNLSQRPVTPAAPGGSTARIRSQQAARQQKTSVSSTM